MPTEKGGIARNPFSPSPLRLLVRTSLLPSGEDRNRTQKRKANSLNSASGRRATTRSCPLPGEKSRWIPAFAGMTAGGFAVFVGADPRVRPIARTKTRKTGAHTVRHICLTPTPNHSIGVFQRPLVRGVKAIPRRGLFQQPQKRADTSVRPYGKRVVQTRKLSLPGRETTKPCGIHPASLSPRRIPFCPEADLALSFISRERPSIGNDAFSRSCR